MKKIVRRVLARLKKFFLFFSWKVVELHLKLKDKRRDHWPCYRNPIVELPVSVAGSEAQMAHRGLIFLLYCVYLSSVW